MELGPWRGRWLEEADEGMERFLGLVGRGSREGSGWRTTVVEGEGEGDAEAVMGERGRGQRHGDSVDLGIQLLFYPLITKIN